MYDLSLDNNIFIDNQLEAAIQELDIILNTECTELIGDTEFGVSIDQFLWTLTPTTEEFKTYIRNKLNGLYYLNMFKYDIDVQYYEEDYNSVYHVTIKIYLDDIQYIIKEFNFN